MNDEIEVNVWAFDLLSFAACSIILSFSLLVVSPKYVLNMYSQDIQLSMYNRVYVLVLFGFLY